MKIIFIYEEDLYADGLEMLIRKIDSNVEITRVKDSQDYISIIENNSYDMAFMARNEIIDIEYTITKLKNSNPFTKIILLTRVNSYNNMEYFKEWDIDGMICRKYSSDKIENILRLIFMGEKYFPSKILQQTDIPVLTHKQKQILLYIRKGLSNKQIAYEMHIEEATVKSHLSRVFKKLNCYNRITAVQEAIRLGLIFK